MFTDNIFCFCVCWRYRHLGQFAPLGGEQTAAQLPGDWISIGHSTQWLWYSVYARYLNIYKLTWILSPNSFWHDILGLSSPSFLICDPLFFSSNAASKSVGARGCWWYLTGQGDSSLEGTRVASESCRGTNHALTLSCFPTIFFSGNNVYLFTMTSLNFLSIFWVPLSMNEFIVINVRVLAVCFVPWLEFPICISFFRMLVFVLVFQANYGPHSH